MFNKYRHIVVFYKKIEDIVNNTPQTYSLIAEKKRYDRGDTVIDINTGEIFNVLVRDVDDNNLPVVKYSDFKMTSEERRIVRDMYIKTEVYKEKEEDKRIEKENRAAFNNIEFNYNDQYYYGYKLNLIRRPDYYEKKAKRYTINGSNQNIWIPNQFLHQDGTIKSYANLSFIFNSEEFRNKVSKINNN